MTAMGPERARDWCPVDVGATAVGVAERDALGTTARVVVWPPNWTGRALAAVDAELALLDEQASRFRGDSEISLAQRCFSAATRSGSARRGDAPLRVSCIVSEGLAEAIAVALAAAEWTGGLVDPTVGGALHGLGYDRDFAALPQGTAGRAAPPEPGYVPGWQSVRLDGRRLRLAAGVLLDLGATAKGLGSDRAARAAAACVPGGGVLVSLGGDIAVAGRGAAGRLAGACQRRARASTAESLPLAVPGRCAPRRSRRASRSGCPRVPWRPRRSAAVSGGGAAAWCITSWTRGPACPRRGRGGRRASPPRTARRPMRRLPPRSSRGTRRPAGWPPRACRPAWSPTTEACAYLGGWPATAGGLVKVPATPRMPAAPSGRPDGTGWPPDGLSRPARPHRVR